MLAASSWTLISAWTWRRIVWPRSVCHPAWNCSRCARPKVFDSRIALEPVLLAVSASSWPSCERPPCEVQSPLMRLGSVSADGLAFARPSKYALWT